jgi:CRISPR-associated protein Cmr1
MEYATLELRLETPFLPGSVDPAAPDPDWPLRPSEVKGLWRWWARALAAGALFERGLLHGAGRRDAVKTPTWEEADCVSQIVGLDMGLGYAGGREAQASCFRIRFERVNFAPPKDVSQSLAAQLQRVRLLTLGGRRLQYIDRGSATLVVEEHVPCPLDGRAVEAALGALALALRLSCFGKGGRRGLGCFSVRAYGRYSSLFTEEPTALIKRAVAAAGAVVDRAVSRCRGLRRGEASPCELPPMPALSTARRYDACIKDSAALTPYMLAAVKGVRREDLHNFFLRPARTRVLHGGYSAQDALRQALKAWILGLPREQRGTGYRIIGGASRRASPLMLAIAGNAAYLSAFTSADWPRELEWRGGGRQRIAVAEADVLAAMALALGEFLDYVRKLGGEAEAWP